MGQAGNGAGFVDLVTAHGVLELSCILVGGAAGLSLGWSIIAPGLRTRRASLQREARQALLARRSAPRRGSSSPGSSRETARTWPSPGSARVIGTGVGLGVVFWGLVLWRGRRPRAEPATSPAGTS